MKEYKYEYTVTFGELDAIFCHDMTANTKNLFSQLQQKRAQQRGELVLSTAWELLRTHELEAAFGCLFIHTVISSDAARLHISGKPQ